MREIKFRAFNKVEGKYYYFTLSDLLADHGFEYGMITNICDVSDLEEPEQFTGLRDKNGREIYEGDILAGTLGTAGRGATTRREKPFNFKMTWYRDGWNLSAIDRYCSSTYRWYPNSDDCTVIGNINESPELLP